MTQQHERLLYIDQLLRTARYPSIQHLKEYFAISERTAYEDLMYFRERLRAPLEYCRYRQGYYYADPAWSLPSEER